MRISDWSSDVCSSDLATTVVANAQRRPDVGAFAGLWNTVLLLIGATAVFARLQTALNLIFHSDARQLSGPWAWLRKRVLSFGVEIGRASCRERGCQYGQIPVVAAALKQKIRKE